ncbi:MAG: hypothetical protein MR210_08795 [Erysipelotrichaceae bacterium]|nr:hypothetical protein [Erysipelotrichaceae bacterium]MDY5252029.1 hypothetical protein [Erysipelotrichaceae bacterium]
MKKILFFAPPVIALLLYIFLGFVSGFGAISPWTWFWMIAMFISSIFLFKNKWYGCIGGLIFGDVLIHMSTRYAGQIIDIERPLRIIIMTYYQICGIVAYKNKSIPPKDL